MRLKEIDYIKETPVGKLKGGIIGKFLMDLDTQELAKEACLFLVLVPN